MFVKRQGCASKQCALLVKAVSCAVTFMVLPCGNEGPLVPSTAPVTVSSNGRGTVKYLRSESHSRLCPIQQQLRPAEQLPGNKAMHHWHLYA